MPAERDSGAVQAWCAEAIRRIEADYNRSADTHLIPVALPAFPAVQLYLKMNRATRPAA